MANISKIDRRAEKEKQRAARNRREIIAAGLSRRDMLKMGLLTAGGLLVPVSGLSVRARNSRPVLVRNRNKLPVANNGGFGKELVTTPLHNGHPPAEPDGNPCDYYG